MRLRSNLCRTSLNQAKRNRKVMINIIIQATIIVCVALAAPSLAVYQKSASPDGGLLLQNKEGSFADRSSTISADRDVPISRRPQTVVPTERSDVTRRPQKILPIEQYDVSPQSRREKGIREISENNNGRVYRTPHVESVSSSQGWSVGQNNNQQHKQFELPSAKVKIFYASLLKASQASFSVTDPRKTEDNKENTGLALNRVAGGSWLETSVTSKQLDTQKEEKNAIPIIIIQQQHEPQSLKQRTRLVDEVPVPSKSKQYVSSNSPITYHDHRPRFQTAQMTANQNQITNLGSTPKKLITDLVKFSSPIQSDSNHRNVGVFREKPQQKQLIPVIIIQETNALNAHVVADGSQLITSQEEDQQQGKYMRSSSPSEYGPGGRRVLTWNKQANESSSQPALQEARMKQQWPQGTGNTGFADNITVPGHSKKQQDTKDVWQVKQNQPNLDNRWIVHHQRDDSPWKPSPSLVNDTRKNTVKKPRWVITDNQNQAWTPSPSDTYGKSQHEKPHKHVDWNSQSLVQRQSEGLIREQAKGTSIDHIVPKGWVNSDGQHENSPSNYPISWTQLVAQPFHQEKTQTEQKRLWQDQAQQMQFDFPFQQPQHTKLLPPNELEQYPHGTRRSHHNESDWSPFDSQQNHFGPYMVKNVHQERAQPQKAILPTKTVPVHKQGQDLLTQTRSNDSSEKNVQQQLKQKSAETRLENNRPKNLRKILVPLYQQKTNVSNERHSSRQQVQEQQTSSRQLWDLFSWQYQQLPDTASWKPFRTEGHNTSDAFSSTSRIQTPAARPVSGGWPPNCNDGSQNELRQHLQQTESPQDQNRQQHQEHPQELHHTSHFGNSNLQWHDIYGYSRKKTSWREHHSQPTWTKGASESATEWSLQHDSGGDPTNNDGSGSTATAIGPTFSPIQKQHTNLTSKVRSRLHASPGLTNSRKKDHGRRMFGEQGDRNADDGSVS